MFGWSPSVTTTASAPARSRASMPVRSDADCPSSQSGQRIGSAPCLYTNPEISAECEAGTTAPGDTGALAIAASACSSSGRPSSSASCLRPPKRVPAPAASTRPATIELGSDFVDAARARGGQAPALAPVTNGDDLGHDRQRGLLGSQAAQVQADR